MPIFVEARNISGAGGIAGGHMYLVYVPAGEEDNYEAWRVISAFPEEDSATGPWDLLEVTSQGDPFSFKGGAIPRADDSYGENLLNSAAGPEDYTAFYQSTVGMTPEEFAAAYDVFFQSHLDEMSSGLKLLLI